MATTFNDDRVSLEPAPVKSGDTVHVNYTGILRNSGAERYLSPLWSRRLERYQYCANAADAGWNFRSRD